MALHHDLLEQANHLALREPKKPRQASLRRAVSVAYYAVFHLLVSEGARKLSPTHPGALRGHIGRAFAHGDMKTVCVQFAAGSPAARTLPLVALPLAPDLVSVASAFVELQEARHSADYDTSMVFNRFDVLQKIRTARRAFTSWTVVRGTPNASVFLAALLLQKHWRA
jgi:hypothetical protein